MRSIGSIPSWPMRGTTRASSSSISGSARTRPPTGPSRNHSACSPTTARSTRLPATAAGCARGSPTHRRSAHSWKPTRSSRCRPAGPALDRNGFRPARTVTPEAGLFAVASEAGVLRDDEHHIIDRGRLGPGDMVLVDLERGTVLRTADIQRRLARRRPYRSMVAQTVTALDHNEVRRRKFESRATLLQRQAACGCTREEIELIVKPMIAD